MQPQYGVSHIHSRWPAAPASVQHDGRQVLKQCGKKQPKPPVAKNRRWKRYTSNTYLMGNLLGIIIGLAAGKINVDSLCPILLMGKLLGKSLLYKKTIA